MKIVIAGAGEVGRHLAKMLSDEEQDIIIMDTEEHKLAVLDQYNLMTYHGSATSWSDLKDVKVSSAHLFVAVTPYEARNLLACQMAKRLGARKTLARIDNSEFLLKKHLPFFSELGINHLIYPEYLAAAEIKASLKYTWVRNWFEMFDGQLIVLGVKLRENSILVGKRLRDLGPESSFLHLCAIKRNREIIIPRGDDSLEPNDIAYVATMRQYVDDVARVCGKEHIPVERVFIMGGTEIAEQLVRMVGDRYRIKVVDPDLERCRYFAESLPQCVVVHGDARDTDLLEEEGLSDYNVFVALTDSSEANILGCLMAKEHGVRKTIAHVENLQYINEAEALNIGTIINKKLLASSRIFQIMLDNDEADARSLALADAEVAEFIIKNGARVTRGEIKDLRLPQNMTIAGLVRNGIGQLVKGDTRLQAGDHVVVFCLNGVVHNIEKVFS